MSLEKTFYLLKTAETETAELYAQIGLSISISRPIVSDMFMELCAEEKMHCKQIELMQNIFLQSKDAFVENPETETMVADFLQLLQKTKKYFNERHQDLKPADLISLALDLERNLVEKHHTFFMNVIDPQMKQLFASLNLADEGHIHKLENCPPG
jgi:hypothetical protein